MVGDLTWALSFFNSWTHFHRRLPFPIPPPSLISPSTPTPTPTHTCLSSKPPPPFFVFASPPKTIISMRSATFKFSASSINDSLCQLHPTCPNATPFDFLSALFWTRLSSTHHSLSLSIDSRSLFKSRPLPAAYIPNAFHFSLLSLDGRHMDSPNLLGDIAALIHTHLEALGEHQICSTIQWLESQKQIHGGKYREPAPIYGPHLTCVCMDHFIVTNNGTHSQLSSLIYGAMFEDEEKPLHVSCHVRNNVEGQGLVIVMPSPEGGLARTVTVSLPQDQLALLCKDQAILQLQPTMLLTATPK